MRLANPAVRLRTASPARHSHRSIGRLPEDRLLRSVEGRDMQGERDSDGWRYLSGGRYLFFYRSTGGGRTWCNEGGTGSLALTGLGTAARLTHDSKRGSSGSMGQVDLSFRPSVDVFDANVALGRRHNRRVRVDAVEGTLEAMKQAGVGKALVYSAHAADFDSRDGNELLLEMIQGQPSLVPQFVCNPAFDDLDIFVAQRADLGVRSVRIFPRLHNYPFRDWMVKPWLDWLAAERVPLWVAAEDIDPSAFHDTITEHPDVTVVLSEVHYRHAPWALPLLRDLPNVQIEISRFVIGDGIPRLLDVVPGERVLFGSRFPDSAMAPQLYNLHHSGLSQETLAAICSGNLLRLLGQE